jgi:hypothetical protein
MYYFEIIAIDRETQKKKLIELSCSEWEVCCLLVAANTGQMVVEFKKYNLDATQELKLFYIESFNIKFKEHGTNTTKIESGIRVYGSR